MAVAQSCKCGALIRNAAGQLVTTGAFVSQDGRVVACNACRDLAVATMLPSLPDPNHPDYEPPVEFWRRRTT